ncbi:MAG: winged helix-turn-helix transcriptional regulator [Deltaproteobacteria bacterium]|nr:winged helix-turn-helix transcriptional regulator [Deltaproteobacteria bacterium]
MIKPFASTFHTPATKLRRLSVLMAIHDSPRLSQHKIARITRLSSSMVNNYIKKLEKEGLIQITGNTNRTQGYHLTPAGHGDLFALILEYSAEIIQLYSAAKKQVAERLHRFHAEGIRSIALFGAAETAEVVHAALKDTPLTVTGIVDSDPVKQGSHFNGFIIQEPSRLTEMKADAVLITSFARQEEIHRCIQAVVGNEVIVKRLSDL